MKVTVPMYVSLKNSSAKILMKENFGTGIYSIENLFDLHTPTVYFNYSDFTCVTSKEMFVPLHLLSDLLVAENAISVAIAKAEDLAVSVVGEFSKNDIVRQIIIKKFGSMFIVTKKLVTEHKGYHFCPYSRPRHDICIQHKNNFKCNVVITAVVSLAETLSQYSAEEGDITTSILEFKTGCFVRDQTLAELLCTLTDSSVDTLKEGKLVKRAVGYGLAINYSDAQAAVYKMVMDFETGVCSVYVPKNDNIMLMHDALNMLVTTLVS